MSSSKIFQIKHELWLEVLFGAFSIKDEKLYDKLYDFSLILFRHLEWIGRELVEQKIDFNYDKDSINIETKSNHELFKKLLNSLKKSRENYKDSNNPLYQRVINDEDFFIEELNRWLVNTKDEPISAFNKKRVLKNKTLSQPQTDALTLFLFEESYKEYELILVYTYSNLFTNNKNLSNIFKILVEESLFHLKSFARMMSEMGILSFPRTLMHQVYKFDDLKQFLLDGIKEEEAAKEECLKLAREIKDEELSSFFNFINFQENYHIELMKEALKEV